LTGSQHLVLAAGEGVEQEGPGFEDDIRPLFRPEDLDAMSFAFDLGSYDDVRSNAELIYQRLAEGGMPCDSPWPADHVDRFRAWIDAGSPR
jgi:hypothetical protein